MGQKILALVFAITIAIFILTHPTSHKIIQSLGSLGYIGGFFAGILYISTFTAVPSAAVFLLLADSLNPFFLSFIGGLGAMCGDYIIYKFFQYGSSKTTNTDFVKKLKNLSMLRWLTVLLGALIIASPFPDEVGIALIGITRLETQKFLLLSFILNTVGILLIVGLGRIF